MRAFTVILLILIGIGALVLANSIFIVRQTEQVLLLRLGEPRATINVLGTDEPGLRFKVPGVDTVVRFDKRNLEFDSDVKEITAADQERLLVDAFVRYRISDPLKFFQAVTDERQARTRLDPFLEASLRRVLGSVDSSEIVSGQRSVLMEGIQTAMNRQATESGLGIEVIDVRIRRADLPAQNADQVYLRMETDRRQAASLIRAEGQESALEIRAGADREARVLVAQATEQSERIKGEGDARRNEIYASAYNGDREFFSFYRSLLAYEIAINDGTTLILNPDSEFFSYFQGEEGDR